jgi:hypothetical protein
MKRIYYLPIVIFLLGASSCEKFLETKPTDFLSTSTYYNTEGELLSARAGVYNNLAAAQVWGHYANYLLGWQADVSYMNRLTLNGPFNYNYSGADPYMNGCWNVLWDGVNRANVLLANLDKNQAIDQSFRDKIRGECLFLRGYYYFLLVQYWGGVPVKTTPTASVTDVNIARSSVQEVYDQILADMTAAEPLVPGIKELGFGGAVSKSAVRGMLARVCLTMAGDPLKDVSKYQDAKTWAKKVMDDVDAGHSLNPSYPNIFIELAQNKYDIGENIWEAEYYGNNIDDSKSYAEYTSTGWINGVTSVTGSITGRGDAYMSITAPFYNVFEDGDLRKWWSIAHFTYVKVTDPAQNGLKLMKGIPASEKDKWVYQPAKFRREYEPESSRFVGANSPTYNATNHPLLRYSDVLLMFAEAENAINGPTAEAIAAVNKVRERAWSTGVKSIEITNGGSGYTVAPTVTFSAGNGSTATGKAVISGGQVTAIVLDRDTTGVTFYNEGKYTDPPAITISGGDGSGAEATATIYSVQDGDVTPAQSASKETFLSLIQDERMREFNMEGQRKADLLRWGIFVKVNQDVGNTAQQDSPGSAFVLSFSRVSGRDVLMPIPDAEMTNNQLMTQNPGW